MEIQFTKSVGKTISIGQITFPKAHETTLDKNVKVPVGYSTRVSYKLSDGSIFSGRLYQSQNGGTTYYQSYISDESDRKVFSRLIGSHRRILCNFDPVASSLEIIPKA